MASSDPGELRPPSLPISTTPQVCGDGQVWPLEMNGVGAQGTPISPGGAGGKAHCMGSRVKHSTKKARAAGERQREREEGVRGYRLKLAVIAFGSCSAGIQNLYFAEAHTCP